VFEFEYLVAVSLAHLLIRFAMYSVPGLWGLNLAEKNIRRKLNNIFGISWYVTLKLTSLPGEPCSEESFSLG